MTVVMRGDVDFLIHTKMGLSVSTIVGMGERETFFYFSDKMNHGSVVMEIA